MSCADLVLSPISSCIECKSWNHFDLKVVHIIFSATEFLINQVDSIEWIHCLVKRCNNKNYSPNQYQFTGVNKFTLALINCIVFESNSMYLTDGNINKFEFEFKFKSEWFINSRAYHRWRIKIIMAVWQTAQ